MEEAGSTPPEQRSLVCLINIYKPHSLVASNGEFQSIARQLFAVCFEAQFYYFPGETEEKYLQEWQVCGSRFETGIPLNGAISMSDYIA